MKESTFDEASSSKIKPHIDDADMVEESLRWYTLPANEKLINQNNTQKISNHGEINYMIL